MFSIALVLYLLGLTLGSYLPLLIHKPDPIFNVIARDLPCFRLIFVIAGLYLADQPNPSLGIGMLMFVTGALSHLAEAFILNWLKLMPFKSNNYLIGTLPFGIGAFMITLNFKNIPKQLNFIAAFGRLSFGIYAIHVFFLWIFAKKMNNLELYDRLLIALLILTLSCFTIKCMNYIKPLRFLIK